MPIKYLSYADHSGYGMSGMAYLDGLLNNGIALTWMPFVFGQYEYLPWLSTQDRLPLDTEDSVTRRLLQIIGKPLDYDSVLMHTQPEYWPKYWEQGKRRIGYTVWETDHIPSHWAALLNTAEQIFVPCRFNVDVFQNDGVKPPLAIIPHIYRTPHDITQEETVALRKQLGIRDEQWVFYSINTWTARKAMWETVSAFLDAFTADDPVVLVIKTDNAGVRNEDAPGITPTPQIIAELCAGRRHIPEIRLICRQMSSREIDTLHRIGDCFISLTHSEGWGLGAFDAAGLGNPLIITGWGGHLDYLSGNYFGLVDYRLVPVRDYRGYGSYEIRQRWAQAEREHAVHLLREIVRAPEAARRAAAETGVRIRRDFAQSPVIDRFIKALNDPYST